METIVDPTQAPLGREPELLGVGYLTASGLPSPHQRYRTEAWQLTNGELYVIVTDNGGTSLMNAKEKIAEAIEKRWNGGRAMTIIEDWTAERPFMDKNRFMVAKPGNGYGPPDFDELRAQGLVLPAPADAEEQ